MRDNLAKSSLSKEQCAWPAGDISFHTVKLCICVRIFCICVRIFCICVRIFCICDRIFCICVSIFINVFVSIQACQRSSVPETSLFHISSTLLWICILVFVFFVFWCIFVFVYFCFCISVFNRCICCVPEQQQASLFHISTYSASIGFCICVFTFVFVVFVFWCTFVFVFLCWSMYYFSFHISPTLLQ